MRILDSWMEEIEYWLDFERIVKESPICMNCFNPIQFWKPHTSKKDDNGDYTFVHAFDCVSEFEKEIEEFGEKTPSKRIDRQPQLDKKFLEGLKLKQSIVADRLMTGEIPAEFTSTKRVISNPTKRPNLKLKPNPKPGFGRKSSTCLFSCTCNKCSKIDKSKRLQAISDFGRK
jgi:hypothetical protein